jgi:hypothetical protein
VRLLGLAKRGQLHQNLLLIPELVGRVHVLAAATQSRFASAKEIHKWQECQLAPYGLDQGWIWTLISISDLLQSPPPLEIGAKWHSCSLFVGWNLIRRDEK